MMDMLCLEAIGDDESVLVVFGGEEYTTAHVRRLILETIALLGEQGQQADLGPETRYGTSAEETIEVLMALLAFVTLEDVTAFGQITDAQRYTAVRTLDIVRDRAGTGPYEKQDLGALQYLLKGYRCC